MTARLVGAVAATLALLAGCSGSPSTAVSLTGAGATLPYPVYSKWFHVYHQRTGHQINYQSIGSGAGIKQYSLGTVDFGASDSPMTDAEIAAVAGDVVHVPTVLGAVVLTWNLPGIDTLRLDGATIADIFLGRITRWNDPRLAALNPDLTLPDQDLLVVHRSDGSGTTFVFTDYLAKVSPDWQDEVGRGKAVNWPVGLGGKGNEGVTQQIKQVSGTLGYVESVYASANQLPRALIRNAAGAFVAPSLAAVSAAADVDLAADTDFRLSVTNSPASDAYPIVSLTWLLIHRTPDDSAARAALRDFLMWMVTPEAQQMAAALEYAPLPAAVADRVRQRLTELAW